MQVDLRVPAGQSWNRVQLEEREKDVCKKDCKFAIEQQMDEVAIY